jgi:hypothetical protein
MMGLVKGLVDKILFVAHHLSCGLSAAIAFGFAAYLLDIGGFRTAASMTGGIDGKALTAIGGVVFGFGAIDILMKRLTGKPGAF